MTNFVNSHGKAIKIETGEADAGSSPDNPPSIPNIVAPKIKTLKVKKNPRAPNQMTGTEEETHMDNLHRTSNNAYSFNNTTEKASRSNNSESQLSRMLSSQHK